MALELMSASFSVGEKIPSQFTADGSNRSPELHWRGVPTEARSLALVVDDPDAPDPQAPARPWVHWLLYDIPAAAEGLPEDASTAQLPEGTRLGRNDWNHTRWEGPSPPVGEHHYLFKLYALDTPLGDLGELRREELEKAMRGHVVGEARLSGTYRRAGR
jgi:Raf kinase inhibitor-like YbhB/YbcL family protein